MQVMSFENGTVTIWKDILGYEGLYQISEQGKVRKICSDGSYKSMKLQTSTIGYRLVGLTKDHKTKLYYVHRLVLECFVGLPKKNPDGSELRTSPECNHKDGVRSNNHYSNLEWCDRYYNNQHRKPSSEWNFKKRGNDNA